MKGEVEGKKVGGKILGAWVFECAWVLLAGLVGDGRWLMGDGLLSQSVSRGGSQPGWDILVAFF